MTNEKEIERSPSIVKVLYYYQRVSMGFSSRRFDITTIEKPLGNRTFIVITPQASSTFVDCKDFRGKGKPSAEQVIYIKENGVFMYRYTAVDFYKIWWNLPEITVTSPDGVQVFGKPTPLKELKQFVDSLEANSPKEDAGFEKILAKQKEFKQQEEQQFPQSAIFYQHTSGVPEELTPTKGFLLTKTYPSQREQAFPNGVPSRPKNTLFVVNEDELVVRKKLTKFSLNKTISSGRRAWQSILDRIRPERRIRRRDAVYSSFKTE